ncbi:MAG: outer membrane receptor for ferrienterochelin and colicins [Sphingobacteriales bacterium]|jgi:outer membrane receptor for ferrienterochelin and colicins
MKYLKIIALSVIALAYTSVKAQSISGVVMEEDAKGKFAPLIGVNVFWLYTTQGTTTNVNGVFTLNKSEESNQLVFSFIGYQNDTVTIKKFDGKRLSLVMRSGEVLDAIEIISERSTTQVSFINPIQTEMMDEQELFKAACCNLSESFETNASVDASSTDAVSGVKEIRLLGLSGKYSSFLRESIPTFTGSLAKSGLTYLPGPWINGLAISKGSSSVSQTAEGVLGQINVSLKDPETADPFFVNAYANTSGRNELNLISGYKIGKKLEAATLLHQNNRPFTIDINNDGFVENLTGYQVNAMQRFKLHTPGGIRAQAGAHVVSTDKIGGQVAAIEGDNSAYKITQKQNYHNFWLKNGYIIPKAKYRSMGLQLDYTSNDSENQYGNRIFSTNQQTAYANLIYQDILFTSNHKIRGGVGVSYVNRNENLSGDTSMSIPKIATTVEVATPHAFGEYTYDIPGEFTAIGALRVENNDLAGFQVLPRVQLRKTLFNESVLRLSAGKSRRLTALLSDNIAPIALTYRVKSDLATTATEVYDESWTYSASYTFPFKFNYRDAQVSAEYYYTNFSNRVVVDLDNSFNQYEFKATTKSEVNVFQTQVVVNPARRLELRLAGRVNQEKAFTSAGYVSALFTPIFKGFVNVSYETKDEWFFDVTVSQTGKQRISISSSEGSANKLVYSPDYVLLSLQITKNLGKSFAVYSGVENLLDYKQEVPIIEASNPFSNSFDASRVWGPVFGRAIYFGLRYNIKKKEEPKF